MPILEEVNLVHQVNPKNQVTLGVFTLVSVTIDHLSSEPVYQQLARILREMIKSGALEVGTPMPSAKALAQEHGLAIGTVTRAVDVLREEGLVRTVPGRGVFVVKR
jgi:GntR family transcriptional regulator